MKAENKAFLDANREHYTLLVQAGIIKHLDQATRESLLRIIREEFAPNYIASTWCSSCVADILKFVYVQYDKYLEANPEPVIACVKDRAIDELNIIMNGDPATAQPMPGFLKAINDSINTPYVTKDLADKVIEGASEELKQGKRKRRNQTR